MIPDLSPVFSRYEKLRDMADAIFRKMAADYPQCVTCKPGCSDCCNALFDLSLVEAMYINRAFAKSFKYGPVRSRIMEVASERDRELTKIKRGMFRAEKDGAETARIMDMAASARMPCPLLDEDNRCRMYDVRPITCRLYGIPLDIGGNGFGCGFSGFHKGTDYPAVQLGRIQAQLEDMSAEIGRLCESRFDLADVYVPLSMALLTDYNEAYLGIGQASEEK